MWWDEDAKCCRLPLDLHIHATVHMHTCMNTHACTHTYSKNTWTAEGSSHPEWVGALRRVRFDRRTYPACPVDEVIQLGHHILSPASGKMGGLGDHGSSPSLGHRRLRAKGGAGGHRRQLAGRPQRPCPGTHRKGQTGSRDRTTSSLRPTRPTLGLTNRERRRGHTRKVGSEARPHSGVEHGPQSRTKVLEDSTQTLVRAQVTCLCLQWPHSDGLRAAGPLCLCWGCKRGIL